MSRLSRPLGRPVGGAALLSGLLMLWALPASAQAEPAARPAAAASAIPLSISASRPADSGRLKFRRGGPTCVCSDGLSEKDIAQPARLTGAGDSPSTSTGNQRVQ